MSKATTLIATIAAVIIVSSIIYYLMMGSPSEELKPITIKLTETFNEAKEWVPSTVYLKKGDRVELTVVNGDDDDIHRLSIPELGVETNDIPGANERDVVTFTVYKEGTFIFIDPLAPDWNSPECQENQEGGKEELGEIVENLKVTINSIRDSTKLGEVADFMVSLEDVVQELEESAGEDMMENVNELAELVHDLEEAASIEEVGEIIESLDEVMEELEESVEELICIPPGEIIVEP